MEKRTIKVIANEVLAKWEKISPAAFPYLVAMTQLVDINDYYYADTASSVINYFLANARGFRGEDAKRLKAELKEIVA